MFVSLFAIRRELFHAMPASVRKQQSMSFKCCRHTIVLIDMDQSSCLPECG